MVLNPQVNEVVHRKEFKSTQPRPMDPESNVLALDLSQHPETTRWMPGYGTVLMHHVRCSSQGLSKRQEGKMECCGKEA